MSTRKRSAVWNYFSHTDDPNIALCSLCDSCIMHTASTTNLLKHLRFVHSDEVASVISLEPGERKPVKTETRPSLTVDEEPEDAPEGAPEERKATCRKRSPVWEFFNMTGEANVVMCGLCDVIVTYNSSTTNLIKHLRTKHYVEAAPVMSWEIKEVHSGEAGEQESHGLMNLSQDELGDIASGRKRSSVWNLFSKDEDSKMALCKICGSSFSFSSTSNLMKHLRSKHYVQCSTMMGWNAQDETIPTDEVELEEVNSVDQEGEYDDLLLSELISSSTNGSLSYGVSNNSRQRSIAWYCFSKVDGSKMAECKFCGIHVAQEGGTTSCLLKHFASKHRAQYDAVSTLLLTKPGKTASVIMNSDELLDMQACDETENSNHNASVTPSSERGYRKRSVAWECFSLVPGKKGYAECDFCGVMLKTDSGTTSTLMSHFKIKHSAEYQKAMKRRFSAIGKQECGEADDSDPDYSPYKEKSTTAVPARRGRPVGSGVKRVKREVVSEDTDLVDLRDEDGEIVDHVSQQVAVYKNRSLAWHCFTKAPGCDFALCTICGAAIKTDHGSTSGLLNHFVRLHNDQYRAAVSTQFQKQSDSTSSILRQHFDQLSDNDFSCCFCRRTLRQPSGSSSNLRKHLSNRHPVELKSILASCEAPSVKEEDFDDSETNESEPARTRPAAKRKNTASTLSLKVEQIWKRHCAEREQEHETKMAAMRSRLATLKKSMNELRKEMTSLETEISEAEERRQEEVEREKELGKRFDQSSTEDEAANRTDSADAGADGTNGSMEQTEGMESGTVEQTDGPVICDNLLAVSCTEVENVEIPPDSEAVEIVIDNIGTVLMNVDNNTWM